MTLEAAFVLPFFLFAVINIIFSMNILAAQSRINAALHQTGNKMAFAAYAVQDLAGGGAGGALAGVALSELYARSRIVEYAGSGFLDQSCISSGSAGLSMLGSQVMGEGDVIEMDIRQTPGNANFRLDGCFDTYTAHMEVESRFGYTYEMTRQYGFY